MQCDVCQQKEATVFLTQILEGKMQKVNLCDACSKEKGVQDPTGFALADLLLGIGAAEEIEKRTDGLKMPGLRVHPGRFQEDGPARLQRVLRVFAEGLGFVLKAMHKGTEHVGKLLQRAHAKSSWTIGCAP